jgi:hypothetical protein
LQLACQVAGVSGKGSKVELVARLARHKVATRKAPTTEPKVEPVVLSMMAAQHPIPSPTAEATERAELLARLATYDTATLREIVALSCKPAVKVA